MVNAPGLVILTSALTGFGPLGVFCFGSAVLSAIIVLRFVVEEPIDLEVVALS